MIPFTFRAVEEQARPEMGGVFDERWPHYRGGS